jgi:hypothetical protein
LLRWRRWRPLLQFPSLIPQHGGDQLPRRTQRAGAGTVIMQIRPMSGSKLKNQASPDNRFN